MNHARIDQLESLRGLMALWVVLVHCVAISGWDAEELPAVLKFLTFGESPVEVFMILSGFVIFYLIDKKNENYFTYISRRFFRIYPLFLLCLMVSYFQLDAVQSLFERLPWSGSHIEAMKQVNQDSVDYKEGHLLAHLTLLHGLVPERFLPSSDVALLGPAWSLSLEWQFYLLAPLLFLMIGRQSALLMLIFGVLALELVNINRMAFLGVQAEYFAMGMLSFLVWKKRRHIMSKNFVATRVAFYGIVIGVFVLSHSIAMAIWCLVLLTLMNQDSVRQIKEARLINNMLNGSFVRHIGKISYSLYLSHIIVVYIAADELLFYLDDATQLEFVAALTFVVVILSLIVSHVLYYTIERPFIKFGNYFALHVFNGKSGSRCSPDEV